MDTLVSIGTLAAWGWSVVVLVAGLNADVYFEVAGVITTLILLGRYLEARAAQALGRSDSRAARARRQGRRASCETARRCCVAGRSAARSATCSSSGRARRSQPTESWSRGIPAVDQSMLTGESMPVEVEPGAAGRRRDRSTRTAGSSSARRRSVRTPRWRRSPRLVDGGAGGQGADPAARRPRSRRCSSRSCSVIAARHARRLARDRRERRRRRSPRQSPC